MLGNPVMSCDSLVEVDVLINMFYWHALIPYDTFKQWNDNNCKANPGSTKCSTLFTKAYHQVGKTRQEIGGFNFNGTQPSLDPDDLYQDFIVGNASLEWTLSLMDSQSETIDDAVDDYLNRKDVQNALHAHAPPSGIWSECVSFRFLHYAQSSESMIPFYRNVINQRPDVSILVYSGDIDIATVPFGQTQECLYELDGTLSKNWGPWFVNGATAGYVEQYKEFSYATVKGAGHTVPEYQPFTSIELFRRFLQNQNLDGGEVYFPSSSMQPRPMRQGDVLRMRETIEE